MTTKVIMPQMGESIVEGTITKWLKKVGEKVGRDEPLFEISTDKVDSEIPSPAAGVVTEILVPEGQTVQINTVVAVIGEAMKEAAVAPAIAAAPQEAEEKPAEPVEEAAPPAAPAPETLPPAPVPSPAAPPATPAPEAPPPVPAPSPAAPPTPRGAAVVQPRDIRTSPLVRRLARENSIDLSEIRGTGLDGRITKEDVLSYLEQRTKKAEAATVPPAAPPAPEAPVTEPQPETPPVAPPPAPAAAPEVRPAARIEAPPPVMTAEAPPAPPAAPQPVEPAPFYGEAETVTMTQMRKTIAERMVASKRISAHVNTVFEVDMTSIVQLVEKHKQEFERREGVKLTYTPFFVKALVDTVREFPVLNCSVSGDKIIYKKPVNVGVAVALEAGLIVPVVKDAHLKSFTGIVLAVADLAERARTRRLRPDDVQNGTISITNPGIYGSLFGTPIINQPQVAILGVGGIEKRPVVVNDAIAIRPMVYLSLSFDHRVIDGAVADQFMAKLKTRLQSWTAWVD
jgi:pyruvate dehydrogenase E2 component (dihydrolipoyllysine-residue acetyltransferase)